MPDVRLNQKRLSWGPYPRMWSQVRWKSLELTVTTWLHQQWGTETLRWPDTHNLYTVQLVIQGQTPTTTVPLRPWPDTEIRGILHCASRLPARSQKLPPGWAPGTAVMKLSDLHMAHRGAQILTAWCHSLSQSQIYLRDQQALTGHYQFQTPHPFAIPQVTLNSRGEFSFFLV